MAEDAEWVVESVFGFLRSRLWAEPVGDFLEQRCSVFDDEEENKLSYTEIHHEYKDLVENLLEGFLHEVGISEEQFQQACASPFAQSHTFQSILQPVRAAEDFKLFKCVMVQKNIELQLQAIQIIQERNALDTALVVVNDEDSGHPLSIRKTSCVPSGNVQLPEGVLPDCLTHGSDVLTDLQQQEMELLSEAIRRSKEEYEQEQRRINITKLCGFNLEPHENLKEAYLEKQPGEPKRTSFEDKIKSKLTGEYFKSAEVLKTMEPRPNVIERPLATPSLTLKAVSNAEAAEAWLEQARREAGISGDKASLTHVEKEQLRKRAEYLKQKRDMLMAVKEIRNKPVKHNSDDQEVKASSSTKEMTDEERKNLQKRRHLAEKLKEEVINK